MGACSSCCAGKSLEPCTLHLFVFVVLWVVILINSLLLLLCDTPPQPVLLPKRRSHTRIRTQSLLLSLLCFLFFLRLRLFYPPFARLASFRLIAHLELFFSADALFNPVSSHRRHHGSFLPRLYQTAIETVSMNLSFRRMSVRL